MKNLIKLSFVFAIVFAGTNVYAQTSQDVAASATVQANIVTAATDVVFGTVTANSTANIPADGTAATNAGTATRGTIVIDAASTTGTYTITWANGVLALDGSPGTTLTFDVEAYNGTATEDNGATGSAISHSNGTPSTFYIGGDITAPTVTGSYSTGNGGGTDVAVTINYS